MAQELDFPESGLIAHEWAESIGGAESVSQVMLRAFPESKLFCLWRDDDRIFQNRPVLESWLANTFLRRYKQIAILFMPTTWRNLPKNQLNVDWILSSSHLFAHHAKIRGRSVPKFSYIHTPARYLWAPEIDTRTANPLARAVTPILRKVDRTRAKESKFMAANSLFIQRRIKQAWGRDSQVIYPPVDVRFFNPEHHVELTARELNLLDKLPDKFVLGASRMVPYKHLERVIDFGKANGVDVVLVGDGPQRKFLEDRARGQTDVTVHFLGSVSRNLLKKLYETATVFVFPGVEDFGIAPVEAMAAGTPVVCNSIGGASESVAHGVTGYHLSDFDSDEMRKAFRAVQLVSRSASIQQASRFSEERFQSEIRRWLVTKLNLLSATDQANQRIV